VKISVIWIAAAAWLPGPLAMAHHSMAGTYLLDRQVELRGTVKQFLLRNPHTFLLIDAPAENGRIEEWTVEWGPAGPLVAHGIGANSIKIGDFLELTIRPPREQADRHGMVKTLRRPSDGFEWGTKPGEVVPEWAIGVIGVKGMIGEKQ
jgi:hypothetical protein